MRLFWIVIGLVAMGCGLAGAILPMVPATPFFLGAACAFARSSPRLHGWLLSHPRFGSLIADWNDHRAISRRAKRTAILFMIATLLVSVAAGVALWVISVQTAAMAAVATFILTRPTTSPPPRKFACFQQLISAKRPHSSAAGRCSIRRNRATATLPLSNIRNNRDAKPTDRKDTIPPIQHCRRRRSPVP